MCESVPHVTAEVVIVNRQGLHARPVMKFVDLASTFQAKIMVDKGDGTERVAGKNPMQMMLLAAPVGTRLRISASGADATHAIEALKSLVAQGFEEM